MDFEGTLTAVKTDL